MSYTETGVTDPDIPAERLARAIAADAEEAIAADIPDTLATWAVSVADGLDADGAVAVALTEALRDEGWFSNGLAGDYPSAAGHGHYRLSTMFAGEMMVGNGEQYASAMALAARALGMRSRVVLGLAPKDETGGISDGRAVRQEDGSTITQFTGADVTAWVEIRFEDLGWVALHPTPPETRIPDDSAHSVPPDPLTLVRQPPPPLTDLLRDELQHRGTADLSGQDADEPSEQVWPSAAMVRVLRLTALYGSPVWLALAWCYAVMAFKMMALRLLRCRGSPNRRIVAGWASLLDLARHGGVGLQDSTRTEQARLAACRFGIDEASLRSLCDEADYAEYSGDAVSDERAESYWLAVLAARRAMLMSLPWPQRMRARLSLARRRSASSSRRPRRSFAKMARTEWLRLWRARNGEPMTSQ
nr:transglutaminase domain-containing protein [Bifidobacterium miconis]